MGQVIHQLHFGILPTVQSVTSIHELPTHLAIRADSLVLILQNTQHLIEREGWV